MSEKKGLDLNSIAVDCGLLQEVEADVVVKNIDALENNYPEDDLVFIYNYFLTKCQNTEILMYLVRCVDKHRDKSSIGVVLDLLLNRANPVNLRIMCAKVAANFKDTSAVTPILYCLNNKDEHYKLRLACADSLGRIGDKYAVAPLIDLVQDEEEKSVYVRESAAAALGLLGDIRAVDPLVSILESKKGFLDKFTFLKERVIEALGKLNLNSGKVFNALKHALMDESACIRINAIEALMDSEEEEAHDLIKGMLFDRDEEVKKNALIALYNMVGTDILKEILENEEYDEFLKDEAQNIIDEYESDDEEEYE